jgi:hypothetical protein
MKGQLECLDHGQHVLFREGEFGDPLPVVQQLSFFAYAAHVIARFANRAQHAEVRVGRGRSSFWERLLSTKQHGR